MRSFGKTEFLIHFAGIVGDHDLVVQHWIDEEHWENALDALKRQVRSLMSILPYFFNFFPRRQTRSFTIHTPLSCCEAVRWEQWMLG
jgi:hypothetical protein